MFMEDYRRRSDGAIVRFHCSDRASEAKALSLVQTGRYSRLVKQTTVVDSSGTKIGKRLVWGSRGDAEITWNEGARLFAIDADSLKDALIFEKSKPWGPGCWDARSWP